MSIASLASKNVDDQPQKLRGSLILLQDGNIETFIQSFPDLEILNSEFSNFTSIRPNTEYGAKAISQFYLSNFMDPVHDAINKGKAREWIENGFHNEINQPLLRKALLWVTKPTTNGGDGGNGVYVVTGYTLIEDPHLSTASSTTTFEALGNHLYSLQAYRVLRKDGEFRLSKTPNEIQ